MADIPISVYIIACNEESRIGTAIRSVSKWAAEVIVVDSGSTDATVETARRLGAVVLHRDWTGYGPQKCFAEHHCRSQWLLNLDADEAVTPELADEIREAVNDADDDTAAFRIPVTDMLPGESQPSWFAYSYRIPRLYNRRLAAMSDHAYQDRVRVREGRVRSLRHQILHFSFRSWQDTVTKLNFYTSQVAEERRDRRNRFLGLRLWTEFPLTFLKMWLGRRHVFRGAQGLAISLTVAYLNLLRLLKTLELQETGTSKADMSAADHSDDAVAVEFRKQAAAEPPGGAAESQAA